jgi:hypothetical protein
MEGKIDVLLGIEKGGREAPQLTRERTELHRRELVADLDRQLRAGLIPTPRGFGQWVIDGRITDGYGKEYSAGDLLDLEIIRFEDGAWKWSPGEVEARVPRPLFGLRSGGMSERF